VHGRRTAMILGAGASFCYEDGNGPLPLQKDIVGRLGGISVSSGEGAPTFVGPSGLTYSHALAKVLNERYGIHEDPSPGVNRLLFWDTLRERGETLETVYAELARSLPEDQRWVLEDFAAVLRTSVEQPIPQRDIAHVCRHHRRLATALEPGDYIVSFNWDSLMADALLYFCPFWYPRTGFGPWQLAAITGVRTKALRIQSLVHLHHIHGSVLLFELLEKGPDSKGTGQLLYLGPPGYTELNSLMSLIGTSRESPEPKRNASDVEQWAVGRGYLYVDDRWFKPLFVPPCMQKGEYAHSYHTVLRRRIHTLLPVTEAYVIIGYSFPPADFEHLSGIFVPAVMQGGAELLAVDPSCPDPAFQSRVKRIFPDMSKYDFTHTDFKTFGADSDENAATIFA
jgi:hypothetical protein